ncbi:MAG: hypothetical protein H6Q06_2053 [Acidobacteria bacterium]|nr:hypothetical protein [Acidobacteriota bacterium]
MKCSRLLLLLPALAAASILWAEPRVKTGLDVLIDRDFAPIAGKRVGVITNHTGLTSDGRHIVDVLSRSSKVKLVAIFTPEHGLAGTQDDPNVASGTHEATGTPIYSLYNRGSYRPTPQMLQKVDVLIYDIQDIGARFYTYITTLGYALEEAARAGKSFLVLDRPNPINGIAVEGPLLDPRYVSFVGYMRMPIRHGMTVGELARMYNGEKALHADLQVIEMQGWSRNMWLDATGLEWVNPSPNIRNLTQAILYPGSCLLESDQVSVGRGTDTPFQIIGAPWFKGREVAEYLNGLAIPGVRFLARRFRPTASVFKDEDCEGLDIQLIDRDALDSVRLGLELLYATMKFHPGKFNLEGVMRLLGNEDAAGRLKRGETGSAVVKSYAPDLDQFRKTREKYLIYR